MTGDDAVIAAVSALELAGIPYMLVGSFSSNFYGIPRATNDADLVIQLDAGGLTRLKSFLPQELVLERQTSFELVTATVRNIIRVQGSSFVIELFRLSEDPHDQMRFQRRFAVHLLGHQAFLPTVEDVIVTKLRWSVLAARSKDLEDVRHVIAVQAGRIDWGYVRQWCAEHQTMEQLNSVISTERS